ncbi:DMT family transporter [Nitrosovibrio sp. Nv17]|jgi:S-adenosylmethionine uptake transporter|uniref:DMT family transporter n=1 Tax=Nitrosovibrio sp. Nv17 TaxID=1855339 RepID=UPI002101C6A2|nr:DMT family transporter [Nitrosovibrio sp. Nv17]
MSGSTSAPWLMAGASLLFATMSLCVKLASTGYGVGEIVFYRGLIGTVMVAALAHATGISLRTGLLAMHVWRSVAGVAALGLWFHAIGELPLATAVTLNYMSPVWMALLLVGGSAFAGRRHVDARLLGTVLVGFAGAVCILQPTIGQHQLWGGLMGLLSGLLAAVAYLQVTALGRAGEPETRTVFYFSMGSIVAGAGEASFLGGWHAHTLEGLAALLAVGVSAGLAQLMITRAYRIGGTLVNASLQYLGIGWSLMYGVLLFDDPVSGMALLGMCLIVLAGIVATRLRPPVARVERANVPDRGADGPGGVV